MPFNRPNIAALMRRGTFIAEEVLIGGNARKGSLFASVVKHQDPTEAPTIAKVHLFAAAMFVIGSMFFVYQEVAPLDQWLLHYRLGCVCFIFGCIAYLVAMGLSGSLLDDGISSRLSDAIIIVSMVLFIVGSAISFHGAEEEVLKRLDLMNWIFLIGSVLLFVDAIKCSATSMLTDRVTLGNYLDLSTTLCFVIGAVFGGKFWRPTPLVVEEGMVLWLFGSCFCVVGPLRVVACRAYDPSILPKKGDENLYGALHATLDGRDREGPGSMMRASSLPSEYYVEGGGLDSASDADAAVSSSEEVAPSANLRRAFP